jgi:hypothetical protein
MNDFLLNFIAFFIGVMAIVSLFLFVKFVLFLRLYIVIAFIYLGLILNKLSTIIKTRT